MTDVDILTAKTLKAQGKTWAEIGAQLHYAPSTIRKCVRKNFAKRRRRRGTQL